MRSGIGGFTLKTFGKTPFKAKIPKKIAKKKTPKIAKIAMIPLGLKKTASHTPMFKS